MYDTFAKLLQERNITPYRICKETGVSQSSLSDWKRGRSVPKIDKLTKMADYLGVTVDCLLGNEPKEKPTATVGDELDINTLEYALYGEARDLDEDEKQQLLELAKLMRRKRNSSAT